ncbi:hypothetical protein GCM10017744_028490 [Streptomyces antimycoticus]|uniref:Uncharacterized protein n=1 Tax=Streptomyces antimycoticus TaxID=68175 RepID=A0A4D4KIB2_9ACTN|nr:hypothetical protein SANT12839_073820 [Streptomyces antimycoticus]
MARWRFPRRFRSRFGGRFRARLWMRRPAPRITAGQAVYEPGAGEGDCISVQKRIPIYLNPAALATATHPATDARSPVRKACPVLSHLPFLNPISSSPAGTLRSADASR